MVQTERDRQDLIPHVQAIAASTPPCRCTKVLGYRRRTRHCDMTYLWIAEHALTCCLWMLHRQELSVC